MQRQRDQEAPGGTGRAALGAFSMRDAPAVGLTRLVMGARANRRSSRGSWLQPWPMDRPRQARPAFYRHHAGGAPAPGLARGQPSRNSAAASRWKPRRTAWKSALRHGGMDPVGEQDAEGVPRRDRSRATCPVKPVWPGASAGSSPRAARDCAAATSPTVRPSLPGAGSSSSRRGRPGQAEAARPEQSRRRSRATSSAVPNSPAWPGDAARAPGRSRRGPAAQDFRRASDGPGPPRRPEPARTRCPARSRPRRRSRPGADGEAGAPQPERARRSARRTAAPERQARDAPQHRAPSSDVARDRSRASSPGATAGGRAADAPQVALERRRAQVERPPRRASPAAWRASASSGAAVVGRAAERLEAVAQPARPGRGAPPARAARAAARCTAAWSARRGRTAVDAGSGSRPAPARRSPRRRGSISPPRPSTHQAAPGIQPLADARGEEPLHVTGAGPLGHGANGEAAIASRTR